MKNIQYHLLALVMTVFVAGSFISSAKLSGVINSFSLTLLRFLIAALVLLPFILLNKRYVYMVKSVFPRSIIMGFFFALFFICLFKALETTTPLNTGTLYTLVPFITAITSVFLFKQKLSLKILAAYLIGAIGTCWVVVQGSLERLLTLNFNQGDLLFLLGCLSSVCFSVSMKILHRDEDTIVNVFCILVSGTLWMTLALLIFQEPLDWTKLNSELLMHMLYLALFATLLSTFIANKATITMGPAKVMAYVYLSPAFVALIMFFFQGTSIPVIVFPGIIMSILATIILETSSSQPQQNATTAVKD